MTNEEKATIKGAKNKHMLHVALIMDDGASKADALILAYAEGAEGYAARRYHPVLSVEKKGGAS